MLNLYIILFFHFTISGIDINKESTDCGCDNVPIPSIIKTKPDEGDVYYLSLIKDGLIEDDTKSDTQKD